MAVFYTIKYLFYVIKFSDSASVRLVGHMSFPDVVALFLLFRQFFAVPSS